MKSTGKKLISVFLAVMMAFGALPFVVFAESESVSADNDVTLTATNTVGRLMTEAFDGVSAQGDYAITEAVFENGSVTVTFNTAKSAKLVVAAYDDETKKMLDSEVVSVSASDTQKSVSFDVSLPDVFIVKAFLLDGNNNALCDAYSRRIDPEAYEDFMSKTTDDFESESVINLDSSKTNNFIVLADGVKKIPSGTAKNVLQSVTGNTYVFTNIDSAFKALKAGDIFYLDNGDVNNLTVIKIKSISISGSTATVVDDEAAADEMFDFIKIGSETEDADFYVEELGEGVTVEDDVNAQAWEDGDTKTKNKNFPFEKTFKNSKDDSIKASGGANFKFDIAYKYYLSMDYSEVSFSLTPSVTLTLNIDGTLSERRFKIGTFGANVYGAKISVSPTIIVSASAYIHLKGVWTATIGAQYDTTNGVTNKSVAPSFKPQVEIAGEFYIGFDLSPSLSLINEGLLELAFKTEFGITIKAVYKNESTHACENCIDGDINWSAEVTFGLFAFKNLKDSWFDWVCITVPEREIWSDNGKLADFYYSFDNKEFGWGECPNTEKVDGLISFGSYPQTRVTDSSLLSALNAKSKTWISYGYYSGTGDWYDGQMTAKDYMKYADVTYNGNKYRAVTFSSYRPYYTGYTSSDTYQDDNGYTTNTTYWFKYEPLKWRVLDSATGFVLCDTIIDSQAYNNYCLYDGGEFYGNSSKTYYANNYEKSSIREWLNDDFYNTAFTSTEKGKIKTTTLDDSASTNDKVFLLSYDEALNTSYFANYPARLKQGSDYAKCQGLYVDPSNECSCWRLRSAGDFPTVSLYVYSGGVVDSNYNTYITDYGVCPALKINLSSVISGASAVSVSQESTAIGVAAAAGDGVSYSFTDCVPGNRYILMNVANYSGSFTLTENNLYYIDQVTADENGKVSGTLVPKTDDASSTTLLFGVFKPQEIKISGAPSQVDYKSTFKLTASVEDIIWKSSNNEVLSVDENGNVTATGRGTATVTATVDGTDISDSVTVTVKYTWWQWIIIILLFGWIWY